METHPDVQPAETVEVDNALPLVPTQRPVVNYLRIIANGKRSRRHDRMAGAIRSLRYAQLNSKAAPASTEGIVR